MNFYDALRQYASSIRIIVCTSVDVEHESVEKELTGLDGVKSSIIRSLNEYFQIGLFAGLPVIHIKASSAGNSMMELLADVRARLEENSSVNYHFIIVPGILAGLNRAVDDHTEIDIDWLRNDGYTNLPSVPETGNVILPYQFTPPTNSTGNQYIGDVIVAKYIFPLSQRHEHDGSVFSGAHISTNIDRDARRWIEGWESNHSGSLKPKVHIGAIAGGLGLVKNADIRSQIQKIQVYADERRQDIIAVEMESQVYGMIQHNLTSRADAGNMILLFAKAISDWGIAKIDRWQKTAAENSVSFVKYCLEKDILRAHPSLNRKVILNAFLDCQPRLIKSIENIQSHSIHGADDLTNDYEGVKRKGTMNDRNTVEHWVSRFDVNSKPILRLLIINGPAGRGKTFFARQIRNALQKKKDQKQHHVWWDCGVGSFSPKAVCTLLSELLSKKLQAEFQQKFSNLSDSDNTAVDEFGENEEITRWLRRNLLDANLPPVYLYLDDLDRYQTYLANPTHPLTSFIREFISKESAIRIIATSRNDNLDVWLRETANIHPEQIGETGGADGDKLRPFTPEEVISYLMLRINSDSCSISSEDLIARTFVFDGQAIPLIEVFGGEPLTLRLFADASIIGMDLDVALQSGVNSYIAYPYDPQDKSLAGEPAKSNSPTRESAASRAVRNELFHIRFNKLKSEDKVLSYALKAIAFLNDERFSITEFRNSHNVREEIKRRTQVLLTQILPEKSQISPDAVLPVDWLDLLTSKKYLRSGEQDGSREGQNSSLLENNDRLVPRLDFDDFARYLIGPHNEDVIPNTIWHQKVAELYAEEQLYSFEAWHRIEAGQTVEAFWTIMTNTLVWESEERWYELIRLYLRLRQIYWSTDSWHKGFVQIKSADILYTAFTNADRAGQLSAVTADIPDQDEWHLNISGFKILENAVSNFDDLVAECPPQMQNIVARVLEDTYLRSLLLKAVHAFESYPSIDEGNLLPGSKGERQNIAIVKTVDEALFAIKEYDFNVYPTRRAILYNFRGCFNNGYGNYRSAIEDYIAASRILIAYNSLLLKFDDKIVAKHFGGFTDDFLDISNNWARTRFLWFGPSIALTGVSPLDEHLLSNDKVQDIARFSQMMNDIWQRKDPAINRNTFSYALINIVYIYLALGDTKQSRKWLTRSYINSMAPSNLPPEDKKFRKCDGWVEAYFSALEAILYLYKTRNFKETCRLMELASNRFGWNEFGFIRDEMIIYCNIHLIKIAEIDMDSSDAKDKRKIIVHEFFNSLEREMQVDDGVFKIRTILDEPIVKDMVSYLFACANSESGNPEEGIAEASRLLKLDSDVIKQQIQDTVMRFPGQFGEGKPGFFDNGWMPAMLLRGPLQMVNTAHSPHPSLFSDKIQNVISEEIN
jgi:hypothetical protein